MPTINLPDNIPTLKVLGAMDLNKQRFVVNHTVLTPDRLGGSSNDKVVNDGYSVKKT